MKFAVIASACCAIMFCASPAFARLADIDGRAPPPPASYDRAETPVTAVYGYFMCIPHATACRLIGRPFESTDADCVASLANFVHNHDLFACGRLRVNTWEPVQ